MRGRIRNLESLVVNLINQKQQGQGSTESSGASVVQSVETFPVEVQEPSPETFGNLRITNQGKETYVGAGHWSALLKEIEEVKSSLDEENVTDEEEEEPDERSAVTFGMPRRITKTQLIQEMPSRNECDHLLPLWFNRYV